VISEEHKRDASRYYALHNQIAIFSDIAFGTRFYEFDNFVCRQNGLIDRVLDIQCVGNLQYTFFLKPPTVNPNIKEDETDILPVSTSTSLDLWPVPFAEKDDLAYIGELLLKLFAGESMLKVLKQRGWHLRVICPSSEIGGKRVAWLPKDPNVRTVDFLVDHPTIDCAELWASIVPLDKRLSKSLSGGVKDTPSSLFDQSTSLDVSKENVF